MHSWFNSIHDRHLRHGKLTNMSDHISSQSLLLCLRRSKGLSTRLHCISESHQVAWPLPQVQPPSPHVAFLRRLVLNSDYISSFLCVCVYVTVVLADVSCRLIDVQAATYVWRISCSVQLLGDDQCVDVMNKKLIIDVFGVLHLFLSCCTALLVKGGCMSIGKLQYDYIYDGKRNFGPFACLAHCVTHAASCLIPCQF